jgi:hypothetical protein
MVVIFPVLYLYLSIASWTAASFTLSKAEVASSSKRILGSFKKALAMATLCFWPPES